KTLEEPPDHAIFILATTEAHKVPLTIISRCQRYDFRRIPLSAMSQKLAELCGAEGVEATEEALEILARSATGSLRD
ncbi:MAG TPA: DNA polymerase III subunit gamma/tau, partial [Dehalococcoidia bacterium]|nr:DNA polymerase III subunit gamma/tau [Dehalococcoidia bacterium]